MKKQIDEILMVIDDSACAKISEDECDSKDSCAICRAERIYNAGYRKQSEREWVENEDDFWILCSVCGIELWDEQDDKRTPYCPFCGAKMKGIKKEFNHGGFESQALN